MLCCRLSCLFVHVQIFWQTIGTSCSDTTAPYRCIRHNNADFFHCRRTQDFFSAYCGEHRSFSVVFLPKNNRKIPRSLLSGKKIHTSGKHVYDAAYEHGIDVRHHIKPFRLQAGIINQSQYSVLVGVVVASAVIPTFIAQKWFIPVEDEDIFED